MYAGFIKKDLQLFLSEIDTRHYDFGGEKFEFGAQRNELWFVVCHYWLIIREKREKRNF